MSTRVTLLTRYSLALLTVTSLGYLAARALVSLGLGEASDPVQSPLFPAAFSGFAAASGSFALEARLSPPVRFMGTLVFGLSGSVSLGNLVAVDQWAWLTVGAPTALTVAVLESGALKPRRCPDTHLRGMPWQFRRCSSAECSGRLVHVLSLEGGACIFCREEREVKARLSRPREPSRGRCEHRYQRGSPLNPVERCYCGEHRFCRSEFVGAYCPEKGCRFGQARAEERARKRLGHGGLAVP